VTDCVFMGVFLYSFLALLAVCRLSPVKAQDADAPQCVDCDDIPTPWMQKNGYSCDAAPRFLLNKRCSSTYWELNKFCSKSCYDWGEGDLVCCPACKVCDDIPSPRMTSVIGNTCGHSYADGYRDPARWMLNRCSSKSSAWRRNKFCMYECFRLGFGYDGISCCPLTPPEDSESLLRSEWIALIESRSPATTFDDPTSAQYLALDWLLEEFLSRTTTPTSFQYDDDQVLQKFAVATVWFTFFGTSNSYRADFPVEQLITPRSRPGGFDRQISFPKETWLLTSLTSLSFDERLGDTIPSELGLLTSLMSLDFGYPKDGLERSIPSELGSLTSLTALRSYNVNGDLPPEVLLSLTSLKSFSVSSLVGTGIPSEVGLLTSLEYLSVDAKGTIPSELGLLTSLLRFSFVNDFTGTVPSELGLLTSLLSFSFVNDAKGTIPSELGLLTSLETFSLVNDFVGTIPSEFWLMTSLTSLESFGSGDAGLETIPSEVGLLTNLKRLLLDNHSLKGTIPSEIFGSRLENLWLHYNELEGTIPTEIGLSKALRTAHFESNNLWGTLPSEIGLLTELEEFYVWNNTLLTGPVPDEVGNLVDKLYLFYIFDTNLSGSIPSRMCDARVDVSVDCDKIECDCCVASQEIWSCLTCDNWLQRNNP